MYRLCPPLPKQFGVRLTTERTNHPRTFCTKGCLSGWFCTAGPVECSRAWAGFLAWRGGRAHSDAGRLNRRSHVKGECSSNSKNPMHVSKIGGFSYSKYACRTVIFFEIYALMCKHLIKIRPNPAASSHAPADLGLEAERRAGATRTGGQTRTIQWYTTTDHTCTVSVLYPFKL